MKPNPENGRARIRQQLHPQDDDDEMSTAKSKTQKKIDKNISVALTEVCEQALKEVPGFTWLTHQADYSNFPASLLVTCVFKTEDDLLQAHNARLGPTMKKRIQAKLLKIGVILKRLEQQVIFDTEEACTKEHDGDWQQRLDSRIGRAVARNRPHPG